MKKSLYLINPKLNYNASQEILRKTHGSSIPLFLPKNKSEKLSEATMKEATKTASFIKKQL
ncbi:hypothetical protein [Candidatus Chlamydia corallus]|uniref:hypothetical protein n=1 Tax=Candidatus Chlamydia corallus TaxID=2038470 RepID=UPI000C2F9A32|nr:hypothetical protein [Candidatus Chlamydia corallus]